MTETFWETVGGIVKMIIEIILITAFILAIATGSFAITNLLAGKEIAILNLLAGKKIAIIIIYVVVWRLLLQR